MSTGQATYAAGYAATLATPRLLRIVTPRKHYAVSAVTDRQWVRDAASRRVSR